MLRALLLRLFRKPMAADPLDAARAARVMALDAYRDAKRRNDSRSVHQAHKALKSATTEVVRLELAR